eukprot:1179689-Prorocentrum_minimum.AAC.4
MGNLRLWTADGEPPAVDGGWGTPAGRRGRPRREGSQAFGRSRERAICYLSLACLYSLVGIRVLTIRALAVLKSKKPKSS